MTDRCGFCGCFLKHEDNSYLGEGGWVENESIYCNNPKCSLNRKVENIDIPKNTVVKLPGVTYE